MTDPIGVDDDTGLPEPPRAPLWVPTQNNKFYRFVVWNEDGRIIDSVTLLHDGSAGHSGMFGELNSDQLEMAKDWMRQLKRNPLMQAVAIKEYLH